MNFSMRDEASGEEDSAAPVPRIALDLSGASDNEMDCCYVATIQNTAPATKQEFFADQTIEK